MIQLKLLGLLLLLCLLDSAYSSDKEKCIEENQVCDQTDYSSYVECVRRRTKRNAGCYEESNECSDCDCDYCSSNDCSSECSDCCESYSQSCTTRSCCHQTCHSQCRSSSCRRRCKSKCGSKVTTVTGGGVSGSSVNNNTMVSKNEARHNITTIINLHNMINNTNVIDIPINVNNTNINNITIEADNPAPVPFPIVNIPNPTQNIPPAPVQNNCCNVIGPRQCTQTNTYPYSKCFHYRKQHCGNICQTSIMHAEPHQVCDQVSQGSPSCHQQIAYIPQPQPRCSYTTSWPYVSCGIPNQSSNCGGCYSHVTQGGSPPKSCPSSCYDDGYNVGPMYRQGPYFQPGYQPVAPCMYTGTCGQNNMFQPQFMPQQSMNPIDAGYSVELLPNTHGEYVKSQNEGNNQINNNIDDSKFGYNPFPAINNDDAEQVKFTSDDAKFGYNPYPNPHQKRNINDNSKEITE